MRMWQEKKDAHVDAKVTELYRCGNCCNGRMHV
jgi:hypothetical protein